MCALQDKHRSISIGEAFIQDRDFRNNVKDDAKTIIYQANTVDILSIFREYNINVDEYNRKCCCPFHNERTASFYYYNDTNSFYCFGCKNGGGPVCFVSLMDDISKEKAAEKIISAYKIDYSYIKPQENIFEKQILILKFSDVIRNFIINNSGDDKALIYAEKITFIFDKIMSKYNLDINGIKSTIKKLILKLQQFDK